MFRTKLPLPVYSYILFQDNLIDPTLSIVSEVDALRLNEAIHKYIREKDFKNADLYAKKMAIYYGVPGLIHYYNLRITFLKTELANGEIIDKQAFNALCYLNLANEMYQTDNNFKEMMSKLLPDEQITEIDYWDKKIAEMERLVDIKVMYNEARRVGKSMLI